MGLAFFNELFLTFLLFVPFLSILGFVRPKGLVDTAVDTTDVAVIPRVVKPEVVVILRSHFGLGVVD